MTRSDTPWESDLFERKNYADFLTNFISGPEVGRVINIDAAWGAGKTFFICNWDAQLQTEGHPTLYVNAWETDFATDPLVPILQGLNFRLNSLTNDDRIKKSDLKILSEKLVTGFKNGLPVILDSLVTKLTGQEDLSEFIQALMDGAKSKKANILESFEERESLVASFKSVLSESIAIIFEQYKAPFFIFIDELDRCRPSYAIELLESIKHVFDIDGVVFVISTDKGQLSHSIKAVYGSEFDSVAYLSRFFDHHITLPPPSSEQFSQSLFSSKEELFQELTFFPDRDQEPMERVFAQLVSVFHLELRDQERCFNKFISICYQHPKKQRIHYIYLIFLVILNFKCQELFKGLENDREAFLKKVRSRLGSDEFKVRVWNHVPLNSVLDSYMNYALPPVSRVNNALRNMDVFNKSEGDMLLEMIEEHHKILNKYLQLVELSGYVDG